MKLNSQKFSFNKDTGYISSMDNPNLVFTVSEVDSNLNEVFLNKKNDDNINQRWQLRTNGFITSKSRPNMVLSIKLVSFESVNSQHPLNKDAAAADEADAKVADAKNSKNNKNNKSIHVESSIVLQPIIDGETGNAHQRWKVDEHIGFIYAFAADARNIEITAANRANICSYYVTKDEEISQPVR